MKQKQNANATKTATSTKGSSATRNKSVTIQQGKGAPKAMDQKTLDKVSKDLDKANIAGATARGTGVDGRGTNDGRSIKYAYPAGMSSEDKKAFRRKTRRTVRELASALDALAGKNDKESKEKRAALQKDWDNLISGTFNPGARPVAEPAAGGNRNH